MLDKAIRVVTGLFGLMLFVMGLRWLVDPAGAVIRPVLDCLWRAGGEAGVSFFAKSHIALFLTDSPGCMTEHGV